MGCVVETVFIFLEAGILAPEHWFQSTSAIILQQSSLSMDALGVQTHEADG